MSSTSFIRCPIAHFIATVRLFLGPTLPDGSINFECHCVGHLVASPCGHEFREAMKCQKAHDKEDMEQGVCAEKFLRLIECFMRTECFKGWLISHQ